MLSSYSTITSCSYRSLQNVSFVGSFGPDSGTGFKRTDLKCLMDLFKNIRDIAHRVDVSFSIKKSKWFMSLLGVGCGS